MALFDEKINKFLQIERNNLHFFIDVVKYDKYRINVLYNNPPPLTRVSGHLPQEREV